MTDTDQEYLTFILDGEEFGIDILCVQEIKVWSPVTEIPNTPNYLKGVINLRGIIVPIVDLRERFQREKLEYSATTVVIILRASNQEHQVMVGLVVDAVSEVYKVADKEIRKAPDLGNQIDNRFIQGMATIEEKIIILLNSNTLLDVNKMYQAAQGSTSYDKETV
ncbi:chemotaxis protein CheW [bacterium]|nr:chemotaxis protein CheW [bacterium]